MYCKHCGKQIDDVSTFCKYCGKSLEDSTNSSQNPTKSIKSLFNLDKRRIDIILASVLWLIIGLLISIESYHAHHRFIVKMRFSSIFVTLAIVGILYRFYKKYCKYPISFFDKSDSKKTKILKYVYIVYTIIFPLAAIGASSSLNDYEGIMLGGWFVPTLFICGIYYYLKSD